MASPYVFDGLTVLRSSAVSDEVAHFARPVGPLEEGRFDVSGAWMPVDDPTPVGAIGFGIDGSGRAYYDPIGVDEGEEAELYVDAVNYDIWVER